MTGNLLAEKELFNVSAGMHRKWSGDRGPLSNCEKHSAIFGWDWVAITEVRYSATQSQRNVGQRKYCGGEDCKLFDFKELARLAQ